MNARDETRNILAFWLRGFLVRAFGSVFYRDHTLRRLHTRSTSRARAPALPALGPGRSCGRCCLSSSLAARSVFRIADMGDIAVYGYRAHILHTALITSIIIPARPLPTLSVHPSCLAVHTPVMRANAIRSSAHGGVAPVSTQGFLQWFAMVACLVATCHSSRILSSSSQANQ
jgi:hypothetical protein